MAGTYSVETVRELLEIFQRQETVRPLRLRRYDPGARLEYRVSGVFPVRSGRMVCEVERFVGGGYAGQVYKVKVLELETPEGPLEGLEIGGSYALKIFIPPSIIGRMIRDTLYFLGFQGAFSLQGTPAAVRSGALWQKFIRRGAGLRFGSEAAVVNVLATFVDSKLGSCGELSEWVDGRMWRFEVDDNLFLRVKWRPGRDKQGLGSPEYLAKREFMAGLVDLMHEMGAHELARQYEWWSLKSQPNALKRLDSESHPDKGLVAVDFRAGMALLPFLPQCPADFKLIAKGIGRGSLVQFDRGDIRELESYTARYPREFADMAGALEALKREDEAYRSSLPDVAHHHVKLLASPRLWSSINANRIKSWCIRNVIDKKTESTFSRHKILSGVFLLLGLLPLAAIFLFLLNYPASNPAAYILWLLPLLGPPARKLWGREDYRRHLGRKLTSLDYCRRAFRARTAETLMRWHRTGRVSGDRALKLASHPVRALLHLPPSFLPPGLHRFVTDWTYAKSRLDYVFVRPLRLYFRADEREKWLRDMIGEGEKRGMLRPEEAWHIRSQIKEPFIQKYLKSLAVHVCTLPVTQIVSVSIAIIYVKLHPEFTWQQASVATGLILGLFQVIPISPGSLARGFYTTFLVLRERNFKDYNIAFFLSYFKYIGYLAFPIQMAYRYPELARFMAGHWATSAVHIVPVFGERGAWLEHSVFDLFYNYPLSLQRRIRQRDARMAGEKRRSWLLPAVVLGGLGVLAAADCLFLRVTGRLPVLGDIWWAALFVPALFSSAVSVWGNLERISRRILAGTLAGGLIGLFYALFNTLFSFFLSSASPGAFPFGRFLGQFASKALWQIFLFALLALAGAFIAETRAPKDIPARSRT